MQLAPHGSYTPQSEPLLDGDAGTAQTLAKIRTLVDQGKKDPFVNRVTGSILRGELGGGAPIPPYDELAEIRRIFAWVERNIRFTKDPEGKECLRPARTTIEWGFGDCDDINAILLPSMLGTVGYHVRIVTISSHPAAPEQFSHVYCEVNFRGRWIPLDAARKNTEFGREPSHHFRKRIWSLASDSFQDIRGLGCGACGGACAGCSMRRTLGTHMRLPIEGLGHAGRRYPSSGLGHAGRRYPSSGLGQDGFDWTSLTNVITAAGKAATSAIAASNYPTGIVYPSASGYPSPAIPGTVPPGGGVSAVGTISSNTLILLAIGAGALLLLARR